jgi:hypothetical protein
VQSVFALLFCRTSGDQIEVRKGGWKTDRFLYDFGDSLTVHLSVASLVAYLASPLAAATNGAAIRVEGGILGGIL